MSFLDRRLEEAFDRRLVEKYAIQPRRDIGYDLPINLGESLMHERQFRREQEALADERHAEKERRRGLERLRRDYGL